MAVDKHSFLLGRKAVAYYNAASALIGGLALTTSDKQLLIQEWLADDNTFKATNLTSVSYDIGSEFSDATTRETAEEGFRSNIPVLRNGQITFDIRWKPAGAEQGSSTDYTSLLLDAWQKDTAFAMVFLDWDFGLTPPSGNAIYPQGMAANWSISMSKTEDLADVQRASITLSVADTAAWFFSPAAASGSGTPTAP